MTTGPEFSEWCRGIVEALQPKHQLFTPWPKYFESQTYSFMVLRSLLPNIFDLQTPHGTVLDIGCGVGLHSLLLSRFADQMIGLDIPGEYLGYTVEGYKSSAQVASTLVSGVFERNNVVFADAFPNNLPLDSDSVDMIFSWTVLEHIPDLPSAYAEMKRVLRPGGLMVHVVPNTMSAIHTIAGVNVVPRNIVQEPLGAWGAVKHLWGEFQKLSKGYEESRLSIVVPQIHSEFLTNYTDQLNLYISDSYLFPMFDLGFDLENLVAVRDFNYALVVRLPH